MLLFLFLLVLLLCVFPLIPGLWGIVHTAFFSQHLSSSTSNTFSQLIHWPGLSTSIALTLWTAIGSTLLSLLLCFWLLQNHWQTPRWQRLEKTLSPLLALPHVAFAIGFIFLFSPSGWFFRLFDAFGLSLNPNHTLIQDPYGLGLLLVMVIKETPFLLLMSVSVLRTLDTAPLMKIANSLGYSRQQTWRHIILPLWLPKIRLPLYAVLGYGLSVVDVALFIGPTRPATFAMVIWQWLSDPNLEQLPMAAMGALGLFILTLLVLGLFRFLEYLFLTICRQWQYTLSTKTRAFGRYLFPLCWFLPLCTLPILVLWSFTLRWRYPALLPTHYTFRFWEQENQTLLNLVGNSLWIALITTIISVVCAIICLEFKHRYRWGLPAAIIALPLVIPPLSLLFGIQVSLYALPHQYYELWVIWGHVLYVFPYVYLTLSGSWQSYDLRYDQCASSLGLRPWRVFWSVRLPQLQSALWLAAGVGMSVSLAQYLPTQMLGAGRVSTITTEAVALASGQDPRIVAIYGLLQGILPLVFFIFAMFASRYSARFQHIRT